jgi:hypothetical protein
MKLLIGNTGLIGTTLKDSVRFDLEYNSKNLHEITQTYINPDDNTLYLSCLSATKWVINQNPSSDFDNIMNIIKTLEQREYKNIILYSTIDVYSNSPKESNEDHQPSINSFNYGNNRYLFEILVKDRLKYDNLLIIRLPALFGQHIKKNIVYDLINKNQIDQINYNSKFQWYNLDNLSSDTDKHLKTLIKSENSFSLINIFPEPIETSEILKIFNVEKSKVNTQSDPVEYNFKTKTTKTGYTHTKEETLVALKNFTYSIYNRSKLKIAVCLFGEERDLLNRLDHWKVFNSKFNLDFFVALYSHNDIYETLKILKNNLPIKSSFVEENNLDKFNQLKFKAKDPIYIYGTDTKALFNRITSQLSIRQKAISLVNLDDYDMILLCRTDVSNFNISDEDIYNCAINKDLIIVNSGNHTHPGGGGGCQKCTVKLKCNEKFHANDICDLWCIGSTEAMKPWTEVYDNVLELYNDIQQTSKNLKELKHLSITPDIENNETIINFSLDQLNLIENDIHCYYPEKIIRSAFKHLKIIDASHTTKIWE